MRRSTRSATCRSPPYIKRDDRQEDRDRYQTVFAQRRGSVAAPTAGLHFTPALVQALADREVRTAEITLHVGYGTFQPVRVDRVEDHRLEPEGYEIDPDAASAIDTRSLKAARVIAVGTTTTRTLEAVAAAQRRPHRRGRGRDRPVHLPGLRLQGRWRAADQLPPSALVADHAGGGVCRPRHA